MDTEQLLNLLKNLDCQYAFYYRQTGQPPFFRANCENFPSASVIKVPILLTWAYQEKIGVVRRDELCDLDSEPQVEGAGFSWLLRNRRLPYQDVLLNMIALSDNLCTNLIIQKIGADTINDIFYNILGLRGTELQRKMMDFEARAQGRDNWISAQDCIRLFDLFHQLPAEDRAWMEPMLLANHDSSLLLRDVPRDTMSFYHKTGSIPSILHDWGYTSSCDIFLLTRDVKDEMAVNRVFGELGRLLL